MEKEKMRPVDADRLLWCYEKRMDIEGRLRRRDYAYLKGIRDCIKEIENAPTVELERKKGKWVLTADDTYEYCTCSECGYQNGENWMNGSNIPFCANCGADMRGEE